ncbi:MAG: Holliday junction resolvase Hjc [Desulfurococcaceae archaeon]
MSTRRRGFFHERDLVRRLWEHGFAVIRAPASGSRVKHLVYPDIVALYKGKAIIAEVKSMSKPRAIYIEKSRVEKLQEFASRASGEAFIAVKIVGAGEWFFVPIDRLIDAGSTYKITPEILQNSIKLEALVSIVKGVRRLTEFPGRKQ